ncbi:unnamed protein product [Didymodactylos carnosus]|uniref:Uncharacterized protein n=1 Tax=Didymodactylos carnosus TaxID=1234261 RepID=A0A8S2NBN0_9BILA|nr:unnamed protein product [Didymodactylos carnosus]CAF3990706.1 unnamed protein product [Didymodactylos carnosus]
MRYRHHQRHSYQAKDYRYMIMNTSLIVMFLMIELNADEQCIESSDYKRKNDFKTNNNQHRYRQAYSVSQAMYKKTIAEDSLNLQREQKNRFKEREIEGALKGWKEMLPEEFKQTAINEQICV